MNSQNPPQRHRDAEKTQRKPLRIKSSSSETSLRRKKNSFSLRNLCASASLWWVHAVRAMALEG